MPFERGDRADYDPPERHLQGEVRQERGSNASQTDQRRDRRRRKNGQSRPQQEAQQMLLFGMEKRVGPHASDASLAPAREEVLISAST